MGVLSNLFGQNDAYYLRDFRNAYHLRPDVNPPRQKFQGYVNFVLNREIFEVLYPSLGGTIPDNTEFRTKISSLVRKASLPEIDFKTEVKNQYNRKRVVNTGLEFTPVNITVLDTVGNEWYTLLMRYYAFYYMNPRNKNDTGNRDTTRSMPNSAEQYAGSSFGKKSAGTLYNFNSNAYGFNLNNVPNFFERVDMILYHGNKGVQYSLMNPVLSSLKTGDIDYASSDPFEFDLTFEYENFVPYYQSNFNLTAFDLNRFENVISYTGDAYSTEGKPPETLESTDLAALGANRSTQNQISAVQPSGAKGVPGGATVDAEGRASSSQTVTAPVTPADPAKVQQAGEADKNATTNAVQKTSLASKTELPAIYGASAYFAGAASLNKTSSMWSEIFKGTVNNGLVAAINGGSVKDAVINTLVGGVVSQGDAWALNLRAQPPATNTNTTPVTTRPAKPAPATSGGTIEPQPVRPGPQ